MRKLFRALARNKVLARSARFLLVISYLLLVIGLLVNSPVWGQSEPTATVDPAIQQKVEERIQRVLTVHAGKKQAFVGEITDITNTTLVLDTGRGEKQAKAGDETIIIGLGKKEIEFKDLEIGSFAITMGYLEETGILDTRRIVIDKKPKVPTRLVAFGEVTDKSSEGEKILTVEHPKKGTVYEVDATKASKITKKIEGKIEQITFEAIEKGDRLVAIGTPSEEKENSLTAKIIHVIPGKAVGQEEATPSAETGD